MFSYGESFQPREFTLADQAPVQERADFILKTYLHLFGAIAVFVGLETVLVFAPFSESMIEFMLSFAGGYSWLVILGAFMGVSWLANAWAHSDTGRGVQYAGLGLYIVAEAVIFLPLIYIAAHYGGAAVLPTAALATGAVFTGLTAMVVITRKNFSFLGPILGIAGMAAFALIACAVLFGFNLGIVFTVAMIALAAGYILYTTSNILHEYRTDQYVAASLALFAAVALLFYYILMLFMNRD